MEDTLTTWEKEAGRPSHFLSGIFTEKSFHCLKKTAKNAFLMDVNVRRFMRSSYGAFLMVCSSCKGQLGPKKRQKWPFLFPATTIQMFVLLSETP